MTSAPVWSTLHEVMEYAIVETGGRQYTVHPGDTLKVEKLPLAEEETLELDRVLLVAKDGAVKVGRPLVEGALVKAQVVAQGKAPKVTVFKFKNKIRYKRKRGHRQPYTELKVTEIVDGQRPPARRRRTRSSEVTQDGP